MSQKNHSFVMRICSLFIVCFALFTAPAASLALPRLVPAPLNPAFVEYNADAARGTADNHTGFRPSPIDWSYLKGTPVDAALFDVLAAEARLSAYGRGDTLPRSFDLRTLGALTAVLDQGGWGTCWAFAGTEATESALLMRTGQEHDLSELFTAYWAYVDESAAKPSFTRTAEPNQNQIFYNGGFPEMIQALYSRGTGPINESDAPYPISLDREEWATYVPNPAPNGETRFRLKEWIRLNTSDDIKRGLTTLGGLVIAFHYDRKNADSATGHIFSPVASPANHAVMLVGWDDDYPRANFSGLPSAPAADGAWLIQNSWGTAAGDHGYYWISYEDATIFDDDGATGFVMEPVGAYDNIYFHDPLGTCNFLLDGEETMAEPTELSMGNVFTAVRNESLVSVGFFTGNTNLDYEIQIYRHLESGKGPESGTAVYASPQRGSATYVGYRAVALDEPVSIDDGERFAVVVTLRMTAASEPLGAMRIPMECKVSRYSEKATVGRGESYLYDDDDGAWFDAYDYAVAEGVEPFNLTIKAFATEGSSYWSSGGSSGCMTGAGVLVLLALPGLAAIRRKKG